MRFPDFLNRLTTDRRTAPVSGNIIICVIIFTLLIQLGVTTLGFVTGCSSAKLLETPPQMKAQETAPSTSFEEPIELLNQNKLDIRCSDNENGKAAATEICQITPHGLKLKIPSDMKGWQAIKPSHVNAVIAKLGSSFRIAEKRWGLENTTLVVTFNKSPDGEPSLGTLGMRLIPKRLNMRELHLEERRGNLLTTYISEFPAGGACVISLKEFMKKSDGVWKFGDGSDAPLPNRLEFTFGPAIITRGSPEITNLYTRGLMSINMIPGGAGTVQPKGENIPGAATLITSIKLVKTDQNSMLH